MSWWRGSGLNDRDAASPPVPAAGFAQDGRIDEHLPDGLFERIGSGRTDADAVAFLADTQVSLTRALVVAVAGGGSATAAAALAGSGALTPAGEQFVAHLTQTVDSWPR
ncbi:hypothetical protein ACFO1B_15135 [Dactylosporangium siamense]|uniref:Uncharacterized protein n=1 Tax=Dactylosporangium siamense TaxID=685454 RepID=A0A919PKF7_9ACTN|nr:hypothetical protein [Dactylosporangium siamense]GIG45167.1 hypothetical protein Dsi01nite_032080 [Dactylosporangium siamense]